MLYHIVRVLRMRSLASFDLFFCVCVSLQRRSVTDHVRATKSHVRSLCISFRPGRGRPWLHPLSIFFRLERLELLYDMI